MATTIALTDLTNGSLTAANEWSGTGVFDVLIKAVNKNIEGQYNLGRITSTDYANVYLGGLQSVIQQSVQFTLQKQHTEAQTDLVAAQKLLVDRQKKGFDDDAKQKLLKQALDSWSVAYSVAQSANAIPDAIKVDAIDQIMKDAMDNLSILPVTPTVNTAKKTDTNPLGIA